VVQWAGGGAQAAATGASGKELPEVSAFTG
jgi:hypothetical protein